MSSERQKVCLLTAFHALKILIFITECNSLHNLKIDLKGFPLIYLSLQCVNKKYYKCEH